MKIHPDFEKSEIVMTFMIGQKNNQNGYKMHYMKMTMMQNQQQELLTYTKQIEGLYRLKQKQEQ